MPILDLVTPWLSAVAASDPARSRAAFRTRWARELEWLQRQRAPLGATPRMPSRARGLAGRAQSPDIHQAIRDARQAVARLGVSPPRCTTILALSDVPGEAFEVIPTGAEPTIFLLLDRLKDPAALLLAQARALTTLARWSAPSPSPIIGIAAAGPWDRWLAARSVPLEEWIYTVGLAEHAARGVAPDLAEHLQFGLSKSGHRRLREHERSLRERLSADLPLAGLGPWLRWIGDEAPPSVRSDGGTPIPVGAGRYLGWRLTAERVERVGLGEAVMMES